jgi:putative phage-type endonuclease
MTFPEPLPAAPALWRRDHDQTEPFDRRSGIGASAVAAVLGISPFSTPLREYLYLTGELPEREHTDDMEVGTVLEPAITALACRRLKRTCVKPPTTRHPVHPYVYASPDGLFDDRHGLEVKNVAPAHADHWGPAGTDAVPEYYLVQAQQQMMVFGLERVTVAGLFWGQDLRLYEVPRHDGLIGCLLAALREFWQRVQDRRPPDPDFDHPSTPALLSALYGVDGGTVSLGAEAALLVQAYERMGELKRSDEKLRDVFKARVLHAMGNASVGVLPDGRTVCRKEVRRAGYSVGPKTYVDFRVKAAKGAS